MEQEIYMWLVSILPSATGVIAILFAAFKIIKEFVALRKDVNCREELRQIIKENKKKDKMIEDLITEMRKQKYDPEM